MGDVIRLTIQRSCESCEQAYHGPAGVYCRLYNEEIWDEAATAAECDDYDPVPWATPVAKGART